MHKSERQIPAIQDPAIHVAAIVVTYNGAHTIQACIESLLCSSINPSHKTKSSPLNLRISAVDNASVDETPTILQRFAADGAIDVIPLEANVGFGAGNNAGIRRALEMGAEYVFLLNQDAFVESDTIERLVGLMEQHPDVGVLSPLHLDGDGDGLEWHFAEYGLRSTAEGREWLEREWGDEVVRGRIEIQGTRKVDSESWPERSLRPPVPVEFVNAAAWMVRRDCFEKAGGFHPAFFMYSEDVEFLQRIRSIGFGIGVSVDCAIFHDRSRNEQKEQRGDGLKNNPLRVHKGAVFSIALAPDVDVKRKAAAIRSKTVRFSVQTLRRGNVAAMRQAWAASKEARNLMHSNVFEDAKCVLFSS